MKQDTSFRHLRDLYERLEKRLRSGGERRGIEGPRNNSEENGESERSFARIRERLKHPWRKTTSRRFQVSTVITTATGVATLSVATETLCGNCLEFDFSKDTLDPNYRPGGLNVNAVFTTFGKLADSSTTCPLCRLVLEGLEKNFSKADQGLLKHRVYEDSKIFASMWSHVEEDETTVSFFIIPPEINQPFHPIPRLTEANLRVFSDDRSFAYSPPLVPWSDPWLDVLKKWLYDCVHEHGSNCCRTLSGEKLDESLPPILPTRVIDISPSKGFGGARLMESNGQRGHYTALSYCWGSAQKTDRPYLTTTKTLERHLLELPWDLLPKTLQDAILLTRAVGMQYLWIDSLCIIQDSDADWEKEASTMGAVYAQARLVIAATTGTNAEAGLFPSQTHIILCRAGQQCYHFRKLPAERGSPKLNLPLFTRGWATQEWVLARRIVFWTEERMCWYCGHGFVRDDGVEANFGLPRQYTRWEDIVTLLWKKPHISGG